MRKIGIALLAVILMLYFSIGYKDENTLVIYSALEQYRNDDIKEKLAQRFPGLNIQVMYMPTAKIAAKIQTEKEESDSDIVLAVETGYMEKMKDALADVLEYSDLDYMDGMLPEHGKYLIWESYGGGFAVNTQMLEKYGVEEPRTYEDLLKPEYKNLVAIQNPKSSSTGYNFYLNLYNMWGEEETLAYFDKLNDNIKQYSESGSGPVKLLIQGECVVGTALTYQVVTEINNGNPLKMIYPESGSPYSLDGVSIVKGKERKKEVRDVFRYLVNECLVYDKDNYNPGKILKNQNSQMQNYPSDIPYADMAGIDDLMLKDELLRKWKY